jgi:outer membrane receptor protein involved in Fe transport
MGRVDIYGLDATLQSHCEVAKGHDLIFQTNYTLQHAEDRTARGSVGYGKQPAYMPRHSGGASVAYENPWVNFVVRLAYCSERWSTNEHLRSTCLPGYVEAGAGVYKQWQLAGLHWEARADLLNAFDKQYEIVRRYPMPGRAYKLSLKVNF